MTNVTEIRAGAKIAAYTATFPARRYWYRHDTVLVDGQKLEGHIQVRYRYGRVEVITCFRNTCVQGANTEWLIKQNTAAAASTKNPVSITPTKRGFKIERAACILCGEPPFGNEYACGHSQE